MPLGRKIRRRSRNSVTWYLTCGKCGRRTVVIGPAAIKCRCGRWWLTAV